MKLRPFKISYPATAQTSRLAQAERLALDQLFSSDQLKNPNITTRVDGGRYISKLLNKRVLWNETSNKEREILSIVDRSYVRGIE